MRYVTSVHLLNYITIYYTTAQTEYDSMFTLLEEKALFPKHGPVFIYHTNPVSFGEDTENIEQSFSATDTTETKTTQNLGPMFNVEKVNPRPDDPITMNYDVASYSNRRENTGIQSMIQENNGRELKMNNVDQQAYDPLEEIDYQGYNENREETFSSKLPATQKTIQSKPLKFGEPFINVHDYIRNMNVTYPPARRFEQPLKRNSGSERRFDNSLDDAKQIALLNQRLYSSANAYWTRAAAATQITTQVSDIGETSKNDQNNLQHEARKSNKEAEADLTLATNSLPSKNQESNNIPFDERIYPWVTTVSPASSTPYPWVITKVLYMETTKPTYETYAPASNPMYEYQEIKPVERQYPVQLKSQRKALENQENAQPDEEGSETVPFSTFLRKLMKVLALKSLEDLDKLIKPFENYFDRLLDSGKLMKLGLATGSYLAYVSSFLKAPTSDIRKFLSMGLITLENRRRMLDDGLNAVLDGLDDVYDVSEEEAMERVLNETTHYPYTLKTGEDIVKGFIDDVFLLPMRRVSGSAGGKEIFENIGKIAARYNSKDKNGVIARPDRRNMKNDDKRSHGERNRENNVEKHKLVKSISNTQSGSLVKINKNDVNKTVKLSSLSMRKVNVENENLKPILEKGFEHTEDKNEGTDQFITEPVISSNKTINIENNPEKSILNEMPKNFKAGKRKGYEEFIIHFDPNSNSNESSSENNGVEIKIQVSAKTHSGGKKNKRRFLKINTNNIPTQTSTETNREKSTLAYKSIKENITQNGNEMEIKNYSDYETVEKESAEIVKKEEKTKSTTTSTKEPENKQTVKLQFDCAPLPFILFNQTVDGSNQNKSSQEKISEMLMYCQNGDKDN